MMNTGGAIVLCSSAVARTGLVNHEAIAAAKAGIVGLTRSAAATYAHRNIRVNCVAPGLVQTPLTPRITGSEAGRKQSIAMHPLGRLGEPEDIAEVIAGCSTARVAAGSPARSSASTGAWAPCVPADISSL